MRLGSRRTARRNRVGILRRRPLRIEPLEDRRLLAFAVNHTPYIQLGNAALDGYNAGLDQAEVLWQTTGTQDTDTFTAEVRETGTTPWTSVSLNAQINTGVGGRIVHSATLTNLNFNDDYDYQITHLRGGNPIATYGPSTFHTRLNANDASNFTFATYGDSASGDPPTNFIAVQNRINALNPAFSLLLGDNVYSSGTHAEYDLRLDPSKNAALTTYNKTHIDYFGFGNHDVGYNSGQAARENYSMPIPVQGVTSPVGLVFDANVQEEENYSYDYGNTHFLTFDTNNWTNVAALNKQLDWAVADIQAARARAVPPQWVIVFGHHPITSLGGHTEHTPDDYYYDQVLSRLGHGPGGVGVDLLLFGHTHNYQRSFPLTGHVGATATWVNDTDNDYAKGGGLPMVIQGTGGVGTGYGANDATFAGTYLAKAMDSSTSNPVQYGFGRVDVTPTTLTYRYINTLGTTLDTFTITDAPDAQPPTASLAAPLDNGPIDLNAAANQALVTGAQTNLQVQLADVGDGIDDSTVTSAAVTVTKNLLPQTLGVDYTFSYNNLTNAITIAPVSGTFGAGQYAVSLSSAIEDQNNNPLAPVTMKVVVDTSFASPVTFRNGENGYTGAQDTYLHEDEPALTHGTNVKVYSDGDDDLGTAETPPQRVQGLIRFDHMFNTAGGVSRGGGPIPDGSSIFNATLAVKTGTAAGDESPTGNYFSFLRMIQTWQESTATWDSLVGGVQSNDVEAAATSTDFINGPATQGQVINLNVTGDLQLWSSDNSLSTRGWAIDPTIGTNGWWFDSSNAATVANRPGLTVKFVPPNAAPTANAGGPYTLAEGDGLNLSAAGSGDSDPGDVLSYSWDIDGDSVFGDALGVSPSLSWAELVALGIGDGPTTRSVRVRIDDGHGHVVDSPSVLLTLNNAAPSAAIAGPSSGNTGQSLTFTFSAIDPAAADNAASFTYDIDWDGNGSVDQTVVGPGGGVNVNHSYAAAAAYTLRATATDKDGGVSPLAMHAVTINSTVTTEVAVVALDAKQVYKFDTAGTGTLFADAADGLFTPIGAVYDAAGNLYVSDVIAGIAGTVYKFNAAGVGTVFADFFDGVVSPAGLAVDASGNLYVANYLGNSISKITPTGVGSVFADASDGVNRPFDVAVNAADGSVYVANLDNKQILKFDSAGNGSVFADAADGLFTPIGVAVDAGGNVYVSDVLSNKIIKFNPAGVGSLFADIADGVVTPTGMSFDDDGNLYVANYLADTVAKITPAGVGSLFADITDGVNHPFDVAVGSVVGGMSAPAGAGAKSAGTLSSALNTLIGLSRLATSRATTAAETATVAAATSGGIVAGGSFSTDAGGSSSSRATQLTTARRRMLVAHAVDEALREAGLADAVEELARARHLGRGRR